MKTLIARWESRRGAHWVDLYRTEGGGYCYSATNGGGTLGPFSSDDDAISYMGVRVDNFQPDSNRTSMARVF